jgi:acyl-CoA synthetase (AMP-forming)/AMP-acid ligase II
MQATPATWRMVLDAGWAGRLRQALCGGEALPPELAPVLRDRADAAWNLYGPTETTIWSALARVADGPITVGRPIANTRIYVLDPRGQVVPDGVSGELWIAGAGVARGYRSQPELTEERFRADPWVTGERMYRTGDLGRWRGDGLLEHLGRLDSQVKVHGFRIELGEIEAALEGLDEVRRAVVAARGEAQDRRLVAYIVFEQGRDLLAGEIRRALGATLPAYMVPGLVVPLDGFPLTPNGKVDRNALRDPLEAAASVERAHEPPEGPVEGAIAAVWQELLGVGQVGRHDNFFELGGHSLLAMRAVAEVDRRSAVRIHPRDMFFRSLSQLALVAAAPAGGELGSDS